MGRKNTLWPAENPLIAITSQNAKLALTITLLNLSGIWVRCPSFPCILAECKEKRPPNKDTLSPPNYRDRWKRREQRSREQGSPRSQKKGKSKKQRKEGQGCNNCGVDGILLQTFVMFSPGVVSCKAWWLIRVHTKGVVLCERTCFCLLSTF